MSRNPNLVKIPKKGSNTLLFVLLVLFLAFVIGLGFFMTRGKKEEQKGAGGPGQETEKTNVTKTPKVKKEEEKEETKKEEEQKTATYSGDYFSVDYPKGWQTKKINSATTAFSSSKTEGNSGDIAISYKENKKNLPIERFYDGINDVNLFEDATGGFTKTTVAGQEAFKFKDLVGETPSTIVVVKIDKAFIEISDNYNAHQTDGIFDQFTHTLKVK